MARVQSYRSNETELSSELENIKGAKVNKLRVIGFFVTLISLCLFGNSQSVAQKPSVWKKVCTDPANPTTCRIRQDLFLQQKNSSGKLKNVGRILRLNVIYSELGKTKKRKPFLSLQLPMGIDLRPGMVLKIDAGNEIQLPFLRCTAAGCDASILLKSKILKNMKGGKEIKVGFRPWGANKVSVVSASLKGFTAAFSAIR
jgi:invasion protein IalB